MPAKLSDSTPGEKLLSLHTLLMLQGERWISLATLAEALKCSRQTVLRLLDQLEASGFGKLDAPQVKGREHFYRLASAKAGLLELGPTELSRLALCRNHLIRFLPGGKEPGADGVGVLYKGYIDYSRCEEQYRTLVHAIRERLVCRVEYRRSIFAEPREFCLAPLKIFSYHESLAAAGWEVTDEGDCIYDNWLWLYLQRFISVQLTRRHFGDLPEIRLEPDSGPEFGVMQGDSFHVRLLFNSRAANYVHDRTWAADQVLTRTEKGELLLEMTARSRAEMISWVLSFGPNVRVMDPDWLRQAIKEDALKIAGIYS